ncbi:V-type proton ATPase subunit G-like [Lytechinus pictus]|uniref:V-type proton ATPase subunit G-like n=1 Tax=Lytechinus pictus TaxID=7653 RepID=UPI0030B9D329
MRTCTCISFHTWYTGKARRLKQAKEEAQQEIEAYKKERETQFEEIQQKYLGSKGDQAREIEIQTAAKIQEINQRVGQTRGQVLNDLFNMVFDIKPELHQNLQV